MGEEELLRTRLHKQFLRAVALFFIVMSTAAMICERDHVYFRRLFHIHSLART
jgi:hypothetical protein